jgi:DNA-binding transcriptional regulator YdaS (Cro superfamily)
MTQTQQSTPAVATDRVSDRLPVFSALHVLGFSYAELGRLLGVSTVSVHHWATGKKPLPPLRHATLIWLTGVLIGRFGNVRLKTRYARRSQLARETAQAWLDLARDEALEDVGGDFPGEIILQAHELGKRALAKLEAQ